MSYTYNQTKAACTPGLKQSDVHSKISFLLANHNNHLGESKTKNHTNLFLQIALKQEKTFTPYQQKVILMKYIEPLFKKFSVPRFYETLVLKSSFHTQAELKFCLSKK